LWFSLYYGTNGRTRYAVVERLVQRLIRPRLREVLRAIQPDVIVSVFPALGYTIHRAVQELGWHIPLGIVVTDLTSIHRAWMYQKADWYVVPTEEAGHALASAGIDPLSIHTAGLPVRREFLQKPDDRHSLRHELGLPVQRSVILIVGGGEGAGRLEDIVDATLASGLPCYLVIVTGRNERLRQLLAQKVKNLPCRALGYVTNMSEWMWASDVLVTKAGPSTIIEAAHCGLPMIVTGAIPGQEEGNLSFVTSNGLGIVATKPLAITRSVAALLTDHALVTEIKHNMKRIRKQQAAREIARLILSSC
jgi:1,2-diacylglycerol 3-beta-galactosyltransferase